MVHDDFLYPVNHGCILSWGNDEHVVLVIWESNLSEGEWMRHGKQRHTLMSAKVRPLLRR